MAAIRHTGWRDYVFWIIGEIASIRAFHFLQVIYFVTGAAVIWFTPKGKFATE